MRRLLAFLEINHRCWLSATRKATAKFVPLSMSYLVAPCTKSYQIFGCVIT